MNNKWAENYPLTAKVKDICEITEQATVCIGASSGERRHLSNNADILLCRAVQQTVLT